MIAGDSSAEDAYRNISDSESDDTDGGGNKGAGDIGYADYVAFFRLQGPDDHRLDRISLVACANQGIEPDALRFSDRPTSTPDPSSPGEGSGRGGDASGLLPVTGARDSSYNCSSNFTEDDGDAASGEGGGVGGGGSPTGGRKHGGVITAGPAAGGHKYSSVSPPRGLADIPRVVQRVRDQQARERHATRLKIVQRERRRIVRVLLRTAEERAAREAAEDDMMRLPKRRRRPIPAFLLSHQENFLHAQLLAQESAEQRERRAHALQTRAAVLAGDAAMDEAAGDEGPPAGDPHVDPQSRWSWCHDAVEREAVRTLLNVQSGTQASAARFEQDMRRIERNGAVAVAKMRARHMTAIMDDVAATQERDAMLAHLEAREAAWLEMTAERRQALKEKVMAADAARNRKIEAHEKEAARRAAERRATLKRRIAIRNDRVAALERQKEQLQKERAEAYDREQAAAQERLQQREEALADACGLLGAELDAKMALHSSRQRNLQHRRMLITAIDRKGRMGRHAHARDVVSDAEASEAADALERTLGAREAEAEERRLCVTDSRRRYFEHQGESYEQERRRCARRREALAREKRRAADALDASWAAKVGHCEAVLADREVENALRQELNAIRRDTQAENAARLSRVEAYRQDIRKAVVDAQDHHNAEKRRVGEAHTERLRVARMTISHTQEIIEKAIVTKIDKGTLPADRTALAAVLEACSPENQRRQHQKQQERRKRAAGASGLAPSSPAHAPAHAPAPLRPLSVLAGGATMTGADPHSHTALTPLRAESTPPPRALTTTSPTNASNVSNGRHRLTPLDDIVRRIRRM